MNTIQNKSNVAPRHSSIRPKSSVRFPQKSVTKKQARPAECVGV